MVQPRVQHLVRSLEAEMVEVSVQVSVQVLGLALAQV
jgi:hypothetical protein